MQIPMSSPDLDETDVARILQVLSTPHLSMGPQIEAFEAGVAAYVGMAHAIGVSSGTSGLHLAIIAAGIGEGDLVITTPFSFIASANCILYERATPVFVDVDPLTLCIDPVLVAETATDLARGGSAARRRLPPSLRDSSSPGTFKALLPVDVFGQPADYDCLGSVAQEHNLAVIEDACEAIGAEYRGRKAGTLGDAAVFAFYPNKQMTTGEGGVIVTGRDDWNVLFRSLRNQGRDESGTWLNHVRLGYNYRMDEVRAALGVAQLARIEELLRKRERVAQKYTERLRDVDGVTVPRIAASTTRMSWFVYVVRLAPEIDRNAVMARLQRRGIACRPYFTPIHLQPFYVARFGYRTGDMPITEAVAQSTLALPFHNRLDDASIDRVCEELRQALP